MARIAIAAPSGAEVVARDPTLVDVREHGHADLAMVRACVGEGWQQVEHRDLDVVADVLADRCQWPAVLIAASASTLARDGDHYVMVLPPVDDQPAEVDDEGNPKPVSWDPAEVGDARRAVLRPVSGLGWHDAMTAAGAHRDPQGKTETDRRLAASAAHWRGLWHVLRASLVSVRGSKIDAATVDRPSSPVDRRDLHLLITAITRMGTATDAERTAARRSVRVLED